MVLFEWVVALLAGAVLLSAVARRIGVPYPALLAIGGAVLALAPGGPRLSLDPGLALALFLAPVLFDAAYGASPRDLRANWWPLTGLIVIAVSLTTVSVAWVARTLRPELGWAEALVLGAVVAPPDAQAATVVLRQVNLPHRVLTVLEGESLLNDAVALLLYRLALSAALERDLSPAREIPLALVSVAGSVVVGVVVARAFLRLIDRVQHVPSSIVLQFVGTFGIWMLAERLHLSAVLTMVSFALTVARRSRMPARLRVPSFAVWDTVVFVLNVFAFVLIGLQLRPILGRLSPTQRRADLAFAAAVLLTVILVRLAWVMTSHAVSRFRRRRARQPEPTVKTSLLVSWCGLRGIVTLAAALALPPGLPERDTLALTAFAVVLGTLLLQGLTLRPLIGLLRFGADVTVEREVKLAQGRVLKAAEESLRDEEGPEAEAMRREYAVARAELAAAPNEPPARTLPGDRLRRRAVHAERALLDQLRESGEIGDDAYRRLEELLDRRELPTDET